MVVSRFFRHRNTPESDSILKKRTRLLLGQASQKKNSTFELDFHAFQPKHQENDLNVVPNFLGTRAFKKSNILLEFGSERAKTWRKRVETTSNTFNFFEVSTHPILGHNLRQIRAPLEIFTTILWRASTIGSSIERRGLERRRLLSTHASGASPTTSSGALSSKFEICVFFLKNLWYPFFDDDNFQFWWVGGAASLASFFLSRRCRCLPRKLFLLSINILNFHFSKFRKVYFQKKNRGTKVLTRCVYFTFCEAKVREPPAGWPIKPHKCARMQNLKFVQRVTGVTHFVSSKIPSNLTLNFFNLSAQIAS